MRPTDLKTKIFLDGGDPNETREALHVLGFLDGQTTNPSLVAKNPRVQKRIQRGETFSKQEMYDEYKHIVQEISGLISHGSVSIEVYADKTTSAEEMVNQAKEMYTWIPNAHIKFPTICEGLKAAEMAVHSGMRINMTLVFNQKQAVAVYDATRGAKKGDVFISPFIGRIDDTGRRGTDLVSTIQKTYESGDGHVEILAASIRSLDHLYACFSENVDIVTVPLQILKQWAQNGMKVSHEVVSTALTPIMYEPISVHTKWDEININDTLTDAGIEKFVADWNTLLHE